MEYKRLTDEKEHYKKCVGCSYRKCQYCDDKYEYAREVHNRLAELEDKIEQGTLIELPCKVGDTVYIACDWDIKEVVKGVVSEIEYTVNAGGYYYRIYVDHEYIFSKTNPNVVKNRYIFTPKELFKAREEAEKRLKEIQG